ncbi:MAG: aminotransferase class I/II-fold pyridoxal phosphate-dependent enzyme, partial [Candidatus Omnitrophica bacterium]|nr:aminotransferase class I/II-fold pyridoxal phosphate-dependent enzyme [Candidatus Omnitrophota bacterium]
MRASKLNLIPYGRQCISSLEIEEVVKVMKSDWITQGPKIEEFESALAQYCGSKYAVAVSSGTAALHLACLATGLKKGDEAVTSPITFLATSNAVVYSNAQPKFADIQIKDGNIDPEKIKKILTKKTKVLLPVCFSGFPTDIVKISKIAKKNHLTIIEDACHALGAKYKVNGKWNSVGSCRHSDMTVFSFHPVKHITTGEGGAITTNSAHLYEKLKILRNHGIYRDIKMMKRQPWNYEMRELGFNYRLTDFQCALGIAQLKRL